MTFWRFQKTSFEDVLLAFTFGNSLIYRNKKLIKLLYEQVRTAKSRKKFA
ncbi:hypothetical protein HMPREF1981_02386 [Bacteroides pyogenes F0041]|uniref:Uncharacterized protein n=1 Tax=Bacteroides pyogenes F0041 TaxID=1321819 RepID=U2C1X4_9BACE|nr:hypothetical protein HMPREF1981_02386 [Bacteroides pyogenes F0041]